jgi:hypothetical protein
MSQFDALDDHLLSMLRPDEVVADDVKDVEAAAR